jgi:hypothetical protein
MGAGVAWLLLIGYAERNLAGTRLWIAGATFDAGNLKPGAIVRHRAWVINPSLRSVEIEPVAGCGCTVIDSGRRTLPPLIPSPLDFEVNTYGKPPGAHRQTVELIVRDGQLSWREQLEVRFTVNAQSAEGRK